MERLTLEEAISHEKEMAKLNRNEATYNFPSLKKYYDNCLEYAKQHEQLAGWLEELKTYKDLEEQGLLVRLPCKVGDIVYVPTRNFISELRIIMVSVDMHGTYFRWMLNSGIYPNLDGFSKSKLNQTVFLTRKEAEKKLEEMKKNDIHY